jgi:ribosomal protein L40E
MVKKTIGYVELEWECPQCGTRNPGPQKMCSNCGSPQPKKVEFQQAAQEELITDESEIARAKAGPDVHCAFCGARNPAGTERCTQCGADLTKGEARAGGRVVGAHRDRPAEPAKCPKCGALNDPNAFKCAQCNASLRRPQPKPAAREPVTAAQKPASRSWLIGVVAVAVLACVGIIALIAFSSLTKEEVSGWVEEVSWERTIVLEGLQDVTKEDWRDEIPSDVQVGRCIKKHHHTQNDPAPNATEVCGTPYTVDTGTGHGEVVQDCEYEVYADWCQYQAKEWGQVDVVTLSGQDLNPAWPVLSLDAEQREGEHQETYKVVFETEKKRYVYETSDPDSFARFQVGSRWKLSVNALGGVRPVEPVR